MYNTPILEKRNIMHRNTHKMPTFESAERAEGRQHKNLVEFFSACKERLFYYGLEDESFYFEQVRDHLLEGGSLDPKQAARILGL
jgi:hypothetical protein